MVPKYPNITVKLIGEDGNAFAILGRVQAALHRAGHVAASKEYCAEATSGDYKNLLKVTMAYVTVK